MVITDITKQKNDPKRVSVYVDGKFAVGLDTVDAVRLGLKVGRELSCGELAHIRSTAELGKAQQAALRLVSARSYTRKGITDKLHEKGFSPDIVAQTLEFLEEYHYVDDTDYTRRYIADALNMRGWGFYKIRQELSRKGVPREVVEACLQEVDVAAIERETILPLLERRLRGDFERANVERAKRWLAGKGYAYDAINWAAETLLARSGIREDEWEE